MLSLPIPRLWKERFEDFIAVLMEFKVMQILWQFKLKKELL